MTLGPKALNPNLQDRGCIALANALRDPTPETPKTLICRTGGASLWPTL
jgi:hypothetical protein